MHRSKLAANLASIAVVALFYSLKTLAQSPSEEPPNSVESIAAGGKIFKQFCSGCHGANAQGGHAGEGMGKVAPNLTDEVWLYGGTNGEIFKTIKMGAPPDYTMVPWDGIITDADIWNVVHYIKSLAVKK